MTLIMAESEEVRASDCKHHLLLNPHLAARDSEGLRLFQRLCSRLTALWRYINFVLLLLLLLLLLITTIVMITIYKAP